MFIAWVATFLILAVAWFTPAYAQTDGSVKIEYIAHACFRLSVDTSSIIIDPYASKIWLGYNFPPNLQANAVFSTHPHYDHDGGIFLKKTPYWKDNLPLYQDPGVYNVGPFEVLGLKGKHCDPYGKEFGQKNTIWRFKINGLSIVHLGDNGPLTAHQIEVLQGADILMVPIDSKFHILKETELQTVLEVINPRVVIPMHYRIPELEIESDQPKDLGDLDPYLRGKSNVLRLQSNQWTINRKLLPKTPQIVVFRHAATVK